MPASKQKKLANGLTPQQDTFARRIAAGDTGADAARAAGYAESGARTQASRLLTRDNVKRAVAKYAEANGRRVDLDAQFVLRGLMHNAELGAKIGPDGKPLSLAASTNAYGLLGKHLRLWVDRMAVELGEDVRRVLDAVVRVLDDEIEDNELRDRITRRLLGLAEAEEFDG